MTPRPQRQHCRRIALAVGLAVVLGGPAAAQTFYKWTDNNGVVHFSDQVPSGRDQVEERHLVAPPVPPPVITEPNAEKAGPEVAVESKGATAATGSAAVPGPPRVVLLEHLSPHTGPSSIHVTGRVRNVGGAVADAVAVTISAADAGQGNPCLEAEASVTPSSLLPGETGNFETDVDSPCLFGDPKVDLAPIWQE